MNGIASKLIDSFQNLYNSDKHYIIVPHRAIIRNLLRIHSILLLMYILSANALIVAIMFPIYFLIAYIVYYFYKLLNSYGYKLLPFLGVILVINFPLLLLANYIREFFIFIFEKGVLIWITTIFQ